VTGHDIETFFQAVGQGQTLVSLQHVVSHLRALCGTKAAAGEIASGVEVQIDTPRVYRGKQLPRALPWDVVQRLLKAIDRTTRPYAGAITRCSCSSRPMACVPARSSC